jgi:hypothetical protein
MELLCGGWLAWKRPTGKVLVFAETNVATDEDQFSGRPFYGRHWVFGDAFDVVEHRDVRGEGGRAEAEACTELTAERHRGLVLLAASKSERALWFLGLELKA